MYIHELENWTDFRWDDSKVALRLDEVTRRQGALYGRLSGLGIDSRLQATAENLTRELVHSSEIEGISLNINEVRTSIARRLGIEDRKNVPSSHYIDGVVAVMIEATQHYDQPLTKEKLCAWQATFFPTGYSNGSAIEVGRYRTHAEHIVSGGFGRERVHYIAPAPDRVEDEMSKFLDWFNSQQPISPIIRSAIAHFWFVSIHPFEDGNGRMARILGDLFLSKGDKSPFRFYNMSSEINKDKRHYYEVLECVQRADGDFTEWLRWYLDTLLSALINAESLVNTVLNKGIFWQHAASVPMTKRQTDTLNLFLDGYEAKLTTKTWANVNKCSTDTANRDIQDLVGKGVLKEDVKGAKRPSYSIIYGTNQDRFSSDFTDVEVSICDKEYYLSATFKGEKCVREHILPLDADRFSHGDLSEANILAKYCSYLRIGDSE